MQFISENGVVAYIVGRTLQQSVRTSKARKREDLIILSAIMKNVNWRRGLPFPPTLRLRSDANVRSENSASPTDSSDSWQIGFSRYLYISAIIASILLYTGELSFACALALPTFESALAPPHVSICPRTEFCYH